MPRKPIPARWTPPRAPSQRAWDRLTPRQRRAVVAALPGEVTDAEMSPPEGDRHFHAKLSALDALGGHFRRLKRRVYLAAELPVYYPAERRFAPDLLLVFDVDDHERDKYVVSAEGKGLDIVFEVHVGGDRRKDAEVNVERYSRLGIPEYFIYDRAALKLYGYRLPRSGARRYVPIVPQQRRFPSQVLGLELAIEGERLRFYLGNAVVLESRDLIARLSDEMAQAEARADLMAREAAAQKAQKEEETASLTTELAQTRDRLTAESRLREEEAQLRAEQTRLLQEETKRREEETKRREEETRRREEETRRREEETRRREEESRLREEEARLRAEETRRREAVERELAELKKRLAGSRAPKKKS